MDRKIVVLFSYSSYEVYKRILNFFRLYFGERKYKCFRLSDYVQPNENVIITAIKIIRYTYVPIVLIDDGGLVSDLSGGIGTSDSEFINNFHDRLIDDPYVAVTHTLCTKEEEELGDNELINNMITSLCNNIMFELRILN